MRIVQYTWKDHAGFIQGRFVAPEDVVFQPDPWVRAKVESGEWTIERDLLPLPQVSIPQEGFVPPDWRAVALGLSEALDGVVETVAGQVPDHLYRSIDALVGPARDQLALARMSEAERERESADRDDDLD